MRMLWLVSDLLCMGVGAALQVIVVFTSFHICVGGTSVCICFGPLVVTCLLLVQFIVLCFLQLCIKFAMWGLIESESDRNSLHMRDKNFRVALHV